MNVNFRHTRLTLAISLLVAILLSSCNKPSAPAVDDETAAKVTAEALKKFDEK